MKMSEALTIMDRHCDCGYLVTFERLTNGTSRQDHFPDVEGGESPIETIEEAVRLARRFAEAAHTLNTTLDFTGNIMVTRLDFTPVEKIYATPRPWSDNPTPLYLCRCGGVRCSAHPM
jgi:hypothetical protein